MDSGNINARSALMALIGNSGRGSQKAASENGAVENNAFAALIASILPNGTLRQGDGGDSVVGAQSNNAKMLNALTAGPVVNAKANNSAKISVEGGQGVAPQPAVLGLAHGATAPGQSGAALTNGARTDGQQKAGLSTQETFLANGFKQEAVPSSAIKTEGALSNAQSGHKGQAQQAIAANGAVKGQPGEAPIELLQKAPSAGAGATDQKTVQAVENRALNAALAGAEAPVKFVEQASPAPSRPGAQIIAQQVAQNLVFIGNNGVDRLRFQLHPAELGQVSVQMRIRDGVTRLVIAAEHPAAIDAMRQNIGALQQALQNAGLQVERDGLQFDLQNQNDPQQQSGADVDWQSDQNRDGASDQADRDDANPAAAPYADEDALFL